VIILTKENAKDAAVVRNIDHPEWGTKAFHYQAQPLTDGSYADIVGTGCNCFVLFWHEYSFWEVVKFKEAGA
jgi:hypothetical protein